MIKLYGWRGSGKSFAIATRANELSKQGKKILILVASLSGKKVIEEIFKDNFFEYKNIDIKIFDDYNTSYYDVVLIDDIDFCVNQFFNNKVDCITESLNDDYIMKGL